MEICGWSISNWWEHFFEGLSVKPWLQAVSPQYTDSEAETIARLLGAAPGAELLDVPCGGGRLSLALADRGYRPTGVDLSGEFLEHARSRDGADRVTWEHREMRDLPWPGRFDGAFCVGNSFGYLDDAGNAAFLCAVAAALKPGARFVLETPMVLENLLGHLQERPWWQVGEMDRWSLNSTTTREAGSTSSTHSWQTAALKCGTVRIGRTDTRNCAS